MSYWKHNIEFEFGKVIPKICGKYLEVTFTPK